MLYSNLIKNFPASHPLGWLLYKTNKNGKQKASVGEDVEGRGPLGTAGGNAEGRSCRRAARGFLQQLNIKPPQVLADPLPNVYPKNLNTGTQMSQMPRDGWMDTSNVVHPHHGILFRLKKECSPDTCNTADEPRERAQ